MARVVASVRPDLVESVYSRRIYPAIARGLGAVAVRVPFSLAEAMVLCAALALVAAAAAVARSEPNRTRRLASAALTVSAVVAWAYLAFLGLWGLNYQREPVASSLGLRVAPSAPGELAAAAEELAALADRLRGSVAEDAAGVTRLSRGRAEVMARAGLGFDAAAAQWPVLAGSAPAVKAARLSPILARLGISGIFVPFTGEPHVNVTLPDWTLPFTSAHEVAHQRGFAREDEANYLAFLSGMNHPDPEARYSVAMEASIYALGALRRVDASAAALIEARRGAGARRDLAVLEEWRARYLGRAAEVNQRVNDAYLRSQGQSDGVQSYGRMVDLLLAERRARAGTTQEPDQRGRRSNAAAGASGGRSNAGAGIHSRRPRGGQGGATERPLLTKDLPTTPGPR